MKTRWKPRGKNNGGPGSLQAIKCNGTRKCPIAPTSTPIYLYASKPRETAIFMTAHECDSSSKKQQNCRSSHNTVQVSATTKEGPERPSRKAKNNKQYVRHTRMRVLMILPHTVPFFMNVGIDNHNSTFTYRTNAHIWRKLESVAWLTGQ